MQEIRMRRKRRQRTGASSSVNSFSNLGGMPSGHEALSVFKKQSTWLTLKAEMMMEGIVLEGLSRRIRSTGIAERRIR